MKLTDLFKAHTDLSDANKLQQPVTARAAQISQQIRALTPGKTLQGEIVSKNGEEIQIKLLDDYVLHAKMDRGMQLEIGKNMVFEVKNNGNILTLSPLFTNMATEANLIKALDMASLPINDMTVDMTRQMMRAGLSIDKDSLQQVFREINLFDVAKPEDIIDLHQLAMPVNKVNVEQMVAYRNFNHQLLFGMTDILDELPAVFSGLCESGAIDDAVELYQMLSASLVAGEQEEPVLPEVPVAQEVDVQSQTIDTHEKVVWDAGETEQTLSIHLGENETSPDYDAVGRIAEHEQASSSVRLADTTRTAFVKITQSQDPHKHMRAFLRPFAQQLAQHWTMRPKEVGDAQKVGTFYTKISTQLKSVAQYLENTGQTNFSCYRSITNMIQNIDFLQQVNQLYAYVQLPLQMQQGKAHGELYVYTNKKNLAVQDGNISALLHLDLQNLGAIDVYVAMQQGTKVSTKFYVADDQILDFLEDHLDLLTERLRKRGYDCQFDMQVRSDAQIKRSAIDELLANDHAVPLVDYAFDVRT